MAFLKPDLGRAIVAQLEAERPEEHCRPLAGDSPDPERTVPVHPAGPQVVGQQPIEARLSHVPLATQPAKVLLVNILRSAEEPRAVATLIASPRILTYHHRCLTSC